MSVIVLICQALQHALKFVIGEWSHTLLTAIWVILRSIGRKWFYVDVKGLVRSIIDPPDA